MSKWKFLGYNISNPQKTMDEPVPYYTEGKFTVGNLYDMVPGSLRTYQNPDFPDQARFFDDSGGKFHQDLQFFEEVADE